MCTLTLQRMADGFTVTMNRDERHDRPSELPPQTILAARGVVAPVDPQSGGTWIAHNDAGQWACLLNGYLDRADSNMRPTRSRGEIIPHLLQQSCPFAALRALDVTQYDSFKLVVGSGTKHEYWVWNGAEFAQHALHATPCGGALFASSSSWQQDVVVSQRMAVFDQHMRHYGAQAAPSYHCVQWPDPASAVLMCRSYSRTHSITRIYATADAARMAYCAVPRRVFARYDEQLTESLADHAGGAAA